VTVVDIVDNASGPATNATMTRPTLCVSNITTFSIVARPAGTGLWVNNIESCGANGNVEVKRIDTSAAFFGISSSRRFLAYRAFAAALGQPGQAARCRHSAES
jgi:hypothetical protein